MIKPKSTDRNDRDVRLCGTAPPGELAGPAACAQQREAFPDDDPVPGYVERNLRKYLECGILAYGFAYMDVGT
ncbi:MAG: hypothetical protein ABW166_21535 [Sedimenticola sp.]